LEMRLIRDATIGKGGSPRSNAAAG